MSEPTAEAVRVADELLNEHRITLWQLHAQGNYSTELLCMSCAGERWAEAIGGTVVKSRCPKCGDNTYLREFQLLKGEVGK